MTAGEVIEVLQRVPADTPVVAWNSLYLSLREMKAEPTYICPHGRRSFTYCTTGEATLAIEIRVEEEHG